MMRKNTIETTAKPSGIGLGIRPNTAVVKSASQVLDSYALESDQRTKVTMIYKKNETKQTSKSQQIDEMTSEQILNDLKNKRLPTFGTAGERKDRLKKHYGADQVHDLPPSMSAVSMATPALLTKKSSCLDEIEKLKIQREERRARMEDVKRKRSERETNNQALGIKVDVDFQALVEQQRENVPFM